MEEPPGGWKKGKRIEDAGFDDSGPKVYWNGGGIGVSATTVSPRGVIGWTVFWSAVLTLLAVMAGLLTFGLGQQGIVLVPVLAVILWMRFTLRQGPGWVLFIQSGVSRSVSVDVNFTDIKIRGEGADSTIKRVKGGVVGAFFKPHAEAPGEILKLEKVPTTMPARTAWKISVWQACSSVYVTYDTEFGRQAKLFAHTRGEADAQQLCATIQGAEKLLLWKIEKEKEKKTGDAW